MLRSNRDIYFEEINHCISYKISLEEFNSWLDETGNRYSFEAAIKEIEDDYDRYDIAVNYSIPLSMVRRFEQALSCEYVVC